MERGGKGGYQELALVKKTGTEDGAGSSSIGYFTWEGRRGSRFSSLGGEMRLWDEVGLPVSGLSMMVNQSTARWSYSRRPQISHTQAGKLGTLTNSSSTQVK